MKKCHIPQAKKILSRLETTYQGLLDVLDLTLAYTEKVYLLLSWRDEKVDIPLIHIRFLKLLNATHPAIIVSVISIAIKVENECEWILLYSLKTINTTNIHINDMSLGLRNARNSIQIAHFYLRLSKEQSRNITHDTHQ